MILLAAVPLVVGALAALLVGRAAHWLPPPMATILLTTLALSVALASGVLLCASALVGLAESPPVAMVGHWSPDVLRDNIPMPPEFGAVGGVAAALLLGSAAVHIVRVVRRIRRMSAAAASFPTTSQFVVVDEPSAFAYAVPGRHGRIVMSTGMLTTLSGPQRRALLAHEEAHLRHHHHLYVQLGRVAAAANPLMWPVSQAIDLAVERWADENAAREIGDRVVVAQALAATALAHVKVAAEVLAGAEAGVIGRVRALLEPRPRRLWVGAAVAACVAVCWIAAVIVVARVHGLMELAEFGR